MNETTSFVFPFSLYANGKTVLLATYGPLLYNAPSYNIYFIVSQVGLFY